MENFKSNDTKLKPFNKILIDENNKSSSSIRRSKFNNAFKKQKKKKEKDVIVCEVENDCYLQSNKAIFIHSKSPMGLPKPNVTNKMDFTDPKNPIIDDSEDDDEDECCITVKDIKDLNFAVQNKVDCIAVSGVHSSKDIEEAKFILGKTNVRILAKIQDA